MRHSDGWVGERVSRDHTVAPDLTGESGAPATLVLDRRADPDWGSEPADVFVSEESDLGKIVGAVLLVVALGIGGFFGWGAVSAYFEEVEPAAELAMSREPTQRFVISGGKIYLEGLVPDETISLHIEGAAHRALGPDRVINNFEISDQAFFDPNQPLALSVAETVLFDTGIASVTEEHAPLIDLAVQLLSSQPDALLTIIGHTDDQGSDKVNLQLSLDRASSVAAELSARGIERDRLSVEGRGEAEPIRENETASGRSVNRRVEFLVWGLLDSVEG